ncbi:MAG: NAD(P)H-hydrate dehydratase [Patescibacteria group bacterium]|nr:NAD(P)H-hydrate dehydratase [Patescibacteria group bacterium]MBU1877072.1 NAD(P)H-hydrate dehydratase [Patescibacteria group bacterium]
MIQVDQKILKKLFPLRPEGVYFHKYSFGFLLVIGGGEFYSGPPALSTMAALASGVDRVEVLAPKRAADLIASFSPNFITFPLEGIRLEKKHLSTLLTFTKSAQEVAKGNAAVLIGGGMGRSEETKEAIFEYLTQIDIPTVIDASAIFALEKDPEIIKDKPFLITPHSFEFFTLTKKDIRNLSHEEKIKIVQQEAARLKTTILLKDKPDIISNGQEVALNKFGSPYMSVGGTGDTLAGICGALLSRQINPFEAAQAAAFINGKAGELAAEDLKESLLATDLINKISKVLHL